MSKKPTVDHIDARTWPLTLVSVGLLTLTLLPMIVYAVYLDRRMDAFEDMLRHRAPDQLEVADVPSGDVFHRAADPVDGQVVYVPAYSHVYHGDGIARLLTITLSVRNTSLDHEIVVTSIRYFDTKGQEVKSYLDGPVRLPALGTTEVLIERDDASGGSGANFLVEWHANDPVTAPIVEAVMIDTESEQGISFARPGFVIGEVVRRRPEGEVGEAGSSTSVRDPSR